MHTIYLTLPFAILCDLSLLDSVALENVLIYRLFDCIFWNICFVNYFLIWVSIKSIIYISIIVHTPGNVWYVIRPIKKCICIFGFNVTNVSCSFRLYLSFLFNSCQSVWKPHGKYIQAWPSLNIDEIWNQSKLNLADDYLNYFALAGSSMKCFWEVMSPDNTSAIREGFWLVGNLFTVLNICMLLWRKRRQKIVFPSYFLTVFILYKWQIKKCFLAAPK